MREVIPGSLWLGNARDARDVKAVLDLGISAVVDLAIEEPPIQFPREVTYCRYPLLDGAGNTPAVLTLAIETTASLVRGKIPALVACGGGMSRAPAIAAAALAVTEAMNPEQALERIAASGPHDVSATFWAEIQAALARRP